MGLKYYAEIHDAPFSDLLRQAFINTEKQLMALYDSNWKYCTDNSRITGAYIIFLKLGQLNMLHMFQYQLLNKV